jgi:MFS family permease
VVESAGETLSLVFFFLIFAMAAVAGSINLPVWFDLVAKLTPVTMRGRLFGVRMLLGSLLGVAGGGTSAVILDSLAYPQNFALLFALAFVVMMISYVCLLNLREETESMQSMRTSTSLSSLVDIFRTQKRFRVFLVGDGLLIISTMGSAFYAVVAMQRFALSDAFAGTFTMVTMATTILASILLGLSADRYGHKANLLVSSLAVFLGSVGAIVLSSLELYLCVFVCAGVAVTASQISRLAFLAELAHEAERPRFIALANMITAPCVFSGIGAGWVADVAGFTPVFLLAALSAALAFGWIFRMVHEPRRIPAT